MIGRRIWSTTGRWDVTDRFVDHRWMTELSAWQKLVFRVRAGRLNRRLGY
ncbi:MAG: hypothetical protein ACOX52_17160 [Verrucomicrobiota bacterium]